MNKEILLSMGIKPVEVNIKSLGQSLYLKELSYKGAIEVAKCLNPVDRSVYTLVNGVCSEDGSLLFAIEDVDTIANAFTFSQIQEIAYEVSKLTKIDPSKTVK